MISDDLSRAPLPMLRCSDAPASLALVCAVRNAVICGVDLHSIVFKVQDIFIHLHTGRKLHCGTW
jgi:hypothetical protein